MHKNLVQYNKKINSKIRGLVAPLCDAFPFTHIWYYSLDSDGNYLCIGSDSLWNEFYFEKEMYHQLSPFFRDPKFYQTSKILHRIKDKEGINDQDIPWHLNTAMVFIERDANGMHGIGFATTQTGDRIDNIYLNELPLLKKFSNYFLKEIDPFIKEGKNHGFSMRKALGEALFFEDPKMHEKKEREAKETLLRKLGLIPPKPLSKQEKRCLLLMLNGKSSSQIGFELGLSPRTVEHYLESVKIKFNCTHKHELFNRVDPTVF